MKFTVVVSLIFATNRADKNRFDVWDIFTPVEADGPKEALYGAISLSKSLEDWKILGYPNEPILYAVRSVHTRDSTISGSAEEQHHCRLRTLVGSISEKEVELLRSFEKIYLPYAFMHID
jgi:hypothetical protein